ncbi:hypothetical protein [Nocardioides sp.]|uniref:hypothetical protein n=1 Tax=Nocardioides sp. TaxID=35761 RepID=UPI00286E814E|nr:hypothetical protein [Nocardioides sp.]
MPRETTFEDETISDLRESPPTRRSRWARRTGTGVLMLVVVLAGVGLFGPRVGETVARGAGYNLQIEYPRITRSGQPAPLHITVEALAGFGDTLQMRLCDEFFNDLDFQAWYPSPSAETTAPPWILYEFDPPPTGNVLEISLDARVAPGQFGETEDCEVSVLVDDEPVVTGSFTVWRMP